MIQPSSLRIVHPLSQFGIFGLEIGNSLWKSFYLLGIALYNCIHERMSVVYALSRFVFVRYASQLLKEGVSLLRWVLIIVIWLFVVKRLLQLGHWAR